MMIRRRLGLVGFFLLAGAAQAGNAPHRQGDRLVDDAGRTLYTYDKDTVAGQSTCDGPCAALWPPYAAPTGARPVKPFTLAKDATGKPQWAVDGQPLYTYVADTAPGMTTGDDVNGIWHVAH